MAENITFWQLVAYIMLTVASVTVALVSLVLAYRQHIGWKPIVIFTGHGVRGLPRFPNHYGAIIHFEVWNRQRYPVVIRSMSLIFEGLEIDPDLQDFTYDRQWIISGNKLVSLYKVQPTIAPTTHQSFKLEKGQSLTLTAQYSCKLA